MMRHREGRKAKTMTTTFIKVKHQNEGKEFTFLYTGTKAPEVGTLVVCSTCYGRAIGIITAIDVKPTCLGYGIKGCSDARVRDLVRFGWRLDSVKDGKKFWIAPEDYDDYE